MNCCVVGVAQGRVFRPACSYRWAPAGNDLPAGPAYGTYADQCSTGRLQRALGSVCFGRAP